MTDKYGHRFGDYSTPPVGNDWDNFGNDAPAPEPEWQPTPSRYPTWLKKLAAVAVIGGLAGAGIGTGLALTSGGKSAKRGTTIEETQPTGTTITGPVITVSGTVEAKPVTIPAKPKPEAAASTLPAVQIKYENSKARASSRHLKLYDEAIYPDQESAIRNVYPPKKAEKYIHEASQWRTGADRKMIQKELKFHGAEFIGAAQLSSGVRFNFYSSTYDKKHKLPPIDVKALDVLINKTIELAQDIPGSPYNQEMAGLLSQAKAGKLDMNLSTIIVGDPELCIPADDSKKPFVPLEFRHKLPNGESVTGNPQCKAAGINIRQPSDMPIKNHYQMVIDSGFKGPRYYYYKRGKSVDGDLPPNVGTAVNFAHEFGHALAGNTTLNHQFNKDQEHTQFVNHLESRVFTYMAEMYKTHPGQLKYVNPFHTRKQS